LLQWVAQFSIVSAPAVAQHRRIDQLYHTAWTIKDGAPSRISNIAQSTEGYLWLTAAAGLYRFDGVTFERIAIEPMFEVTRLTRALAAQLRQHLTAFRA
jgi:ligand-binding sensor domain-containing protein